MQIPPPIFTREYGAWAVLLVPIITGIGVAGEIGFDHLYLVGSSVFCFLSYTPAQIILRYGSRDSLDRAQFRGAILWGTLFLILGIAFAAPLLGKGYFILILMGLVASVLFVANYLLSRRYGKSLPADLVGMLALTLGAPAAWYIGYGSWDARIPLLWLLNFLFFASGAFYVHMKMGVLGMKERVLTISERIEVGYQNLLYHFLMLVVLAVTVSVTSSPGSLLLAFVPITIHAVYGTLTLSARVSFKRLGLILLGHSVVFSFLLVAALS